MLCKKEGQINIVFESQAPTSFLCVICLNLHTKKFLNRKMFEKKNVTVYVCVWYFTGQKQCLIVLHSLKIPLQFKA